MKGEFLTYPFLAVVAFLILLGIAAALTKLWEDGLEEFLAEAWKPGLMLLIIILIAL